MGKPRPEYIVIGEDIIPAGKCIPSPNGKYPIMVNSTQACTATIVYSKEAMTYSNSAQEQLMKQNLAALILSTENW